MKKIIIPVLAVAGLATAACGTTSTTSDQSSSAPISQTSHGNAKHAAKKPETTEAQRNATDSASNYLQTAPFSRAGLIEQLSSKAGEGYARADAVFAVDHLHVDWNQQAVQAAKNYLSEGSFSRQGLIEQLNSRAGDGYTQAQAEYGVSRAYR